MSDSSESYRDAEIIELTGKIMVVAIFLLLFIVVFVFFLHLYAKYVWYRRRENPNPDALRRRRLDSSSLPRRGLEPSILKALPVLIFDPKDSKDGLECAVCLSEISRGEKNRLLPKCSHRFHLECIDAWFESHSTCPLCRNPIKNPNQSKNSDEVPPPEAVVRAPAVEPPNFPTNVLIWGDETRVSTFAPPCVEEISDNTNNVIVIVEPSSSSMGSTSGGTSDGISTVDTQKQMNEDDEQKFPVVTRLRAFKGLLSNNNRRVNSTSPRNLDLEQGGRDQS